MSWPDAFVAATFLLCATTVWGVRAIGRAITKGVAEVTLPEPTAPKPGARKDRLS